jgi:deoxyribonuclease-4
VARADSAEPLLLGAHVSTAGGVEHAPARGAEIGANVVQLFTKQVNRWAERDIDSETADAFRDALRDSRIVVAGSHDSYLINLASPDPKLWERSLDSFRCELARCRALGLDFLVSHPGNATDGDREAGLRRNADAIDRALAEDDGTTPVLIEATAGQGTSLGSRFEELATLLELISPQNEARIGICLDTAHLFAAAYDLVDDYDAVMIEFDRLVGLERVQLLHMNDSKTAFGSRVDRHEQIAEGQMGPEPFRHIMRDERLQCIPKVIETPKGENPIETDRKNLHRLRRYRSVAI